jgi:hypothetical protein
MRENRAVKFGEELEPQNAAVAAHNGTDVDGAGYEIVEFLVYAGAPAAGATLDVKLQESDDNGAGAPASYGDVTSGALPQITTNAGQKVIRVATRNVKRWLRLVFTVGTDTFYCASAYVCRGGETSQPEAAADLTVGFA